MSTDFPETKYGPTKAARRFRPGVIASDQDVAVDDQLGVVILENLGTLPDASDVIALELDVNGDRLIAFDTTTSLSGGIVGGVVFSDEDILRYDGANWSLELHPQDENWDPAISPPLQGQSPWIGSSPPARQPIGPLPE